MIEDIKKGREIRKTFVGMALKPFLFFIKKSRDGDKDDDQ